MKGMKFRVWDKKAKRWRRDILWAPTGKLYVSDGEKLEAVHASKYEVTFFTGLRDKKGKGIWGGDIVKYDEEKEPFIIKWRVDRFIIERRLHPKYSDAEDGWRMGDLAAGEGYDGDCTRNDLEVIGNIYDDIALLQ